MRASIVIATYNEGISLKMTVQSCLDALGALTAEIIVVDDCSTDGSVEAVKREFPTVRTIQNPKRLGVSPTKHHGAAKAQGAVLIFLDAHCKPNRGSLERLVFDVEEFDGQAIITPEIAGLDTEAWRTVRSHRGNGYVTDLATLKPSWIPLKCLPKVGHFYESPNLIGCCLGIARTTYERLLGFDVDMLQWGTEDVDLGLKAWLMGYSILHDPLAVVGHRFQRSFENYVVDQPHVVANEVRLARRNFGEIAWSEWCKQARERYAPALWDDGWRLFESRRASAERERAYLFENRQFDEYWYAEKFKLNWPFSAWMLVEPEDRAAIPDQEDLAVYISQRSRYRDNLNNAHVKHAFSLTPGSGTVYLAFDRDEYGRIHVAKARFDGNLSATCACYLSLACHLMDGQPLAAARGLSAASLKRFSANSNHQSDLCASVAQVVAEALQGL